MRKKRQLTLFFFSAISLFFLVASIAQPVHAVGKTEVGIQFSKTSHAENTTETSEENVDNSSNESSPSTPIQTLPQTGTVNDSLYFIVGLLILFGVSIVVLYRRQSNNRKGE